MRKEEAERYVYIKKEIADFEYEKMLKKTDLPSNTQVLSFTPICHGGGSKTENTAVRIVDECRILDNMIALRTQEIKVIDAWIDTNKSKDRDILRMRIKERKMFEDIAREIGYSDKRSVEERYKSLFEQNPT